MRGGAFFNGKEGRDDFRKTALRAVTYPLPEEEGLGEKVELSLQERRRGRKFSTVGRLHPFVPEGFCPPELGGGTEGGVKTIEERLGEKGEALLAGETER